MLSECVSKLLSILVCFLVSIYLYLANAQIYTGLTERHLASTILSLSALSASSSAGEQVSGQGIFTVLRWRHQSIQFSTGMYTYIHTGVHTANLGFSGVVGLSCLYFETVLAVRFFAEPSLWF